MRRSENILILGLGGIGRYIAGQLSSQGHLVTVIENDRKKIESARAQLDARLILGDVMSFDSWKEAKAESMNYLIAVTNDDAVNLMASLIADRLGIPQKIIRARSIEVWRSTAIMTAEDFKIDLLIRPEELAAQEIAKLLKWKAGNLMLDVGEKGLQILGVHIQEGDPWIGMTIRELGSKYPKTALQVAAVTRDIDTLVPYGDLTLEADDHVFILANDSNVDALKKLLKWDDKKPHDVLIVGGGVTGARVADLLQRNFNVRLIEKSESHAETLSQQLQKTLILHGDGSERETLLEAGLLHMDTVISATGDNETNIMTSVLAKHLMQTQKTATGYERTISIVHRQDYLVLASAMGTDLAVDKKVLASNQILRHIRRGHVLSVTHIHGSEAEAVELLVDPHTPITRRKLSEIPELKKQIMIGAYLRSGEWKIARGDTQLMSGDRVVCICKPDELKSLERLFLK